VPSTPVGAVLGPLLGLALLQLLDGRIRVALAVAVIPAAISVGLVAFVREPDAAPAPAVTAAADPAQRIQRG